MAYNLKYLIFIISLLNENEVELAKHGADTSPSVPESDLQSALSDCRSIDQSPPRHLEIIGHLLLMRQHLDVRPFIALKLFFEQLIEVAR